MNAFKVCLGLFKSISRLRAAYYSMFSVDLLNLENGVFNTLSALVRFHGGQVLKYSDP